MIPAENHRILYILKILCQLLRCDLGLGIIGVVVIYIFRNTGTALKIIPATVIPGIFAHNVVILCNMCQIIGIIDCFYCRIERI